jgi:hypothetical protein
MIAFVLFLWLWVWSPSCGQILPMAASLILMACRSLDSIFENPKQCKTRLEGRWRSCQRNRFFQHLPGDLGQCHPPWHWVCLESISQFCACQLTILKVHCSSTRPIRDQRRPCCWIHSGCRSQPSTQVYCKILTPCVPQLFVNTVILVGGHWWMPEIPPRQSLLGDQRKYNFSLP